MVLYNSHPSFVEPDARHHFTGNPNAPPTAFDVITLNRVTLAQQEICGDCNAEICRQNCQTYEQLMNQLDKTKAETNSARLHVVPLDPIVWVEDYQPETKHIQSPLDSSGHTVTNASTAMSELVQEVKAEAAYTTFKGSDFVFVCLSQGCLKFGSEFARVLSKRMGTRAMFASIVGKKFTWPCPLRVIDLQTPSQQGIDSVVERLLKNASFMIDKRNRWVCSDADHPERYWTKETNRSTAKGIYMEAFGFTMCTFAKSGSTMTGLLLRRMMHYDNWNTIGGSINHNHKLSGLRFLVDEDDPALKKAINSDLGIVKGVIVRNPITRLLSGYLDKIYDRKEYRRIRGMNETYTVSAPPTFPQFVEFLMEHHPDPNKLDQHFRLQSSYCGVRNMQHDFVGKQINLYEEMKEFGQSLGFWEAYGSSGFGQNGTHQFGEKSYQKNAHASATLVWKYYTEELMMKVYEYYKEDFDRFGFSIEAMLDTNPQRNPSSQPNA